MWNNNGRRWSEYHQIRWDSFWIVISVGAGEKIAPLSLVRSLSLPLPLPPTPPTLLTYSSLSLSFHCSPAPLLSLSLSPPFLSPLCLLLPLPLYMQKNSLALFFPHENSDRLCRIPPHSTGPKSIRFRWAKWLEACLLSLVGIDQNPMIFAPSS